MAGNSRWRLAQSRVLTERLARNILSKRKRCLAGFCKPAGHRLDRICVEIVQLLDILDDARHLRCVKFDLGVSDLKVSKFRYVPYIHKLVLGGLAAQITRGRFKEKLSAFRIGDRLGGL